jgi:hypothetical protein
VQVIRQALNYVRSGENRLLVVCKLIGAARFRQIDGD